MHLVIGFGALLLGGWVLNTPPDERLELPSTSQTSLITSVAPAFPPRSAMRGQQSRAQGRQRSEPQNYQTERQAALRQRELQERMRLQGSLAQTLQQGTATIVPTAPTEPAAAGGPEVFGIMPPTAPLPTEGQGQATELPALGSASPRIPQSPTYRRTSPTSTYSSALTAQQQRLGTYYSSAGAVGATEKAFAGYRPFSSGISPYMNLFRRDNAGGVVDNYNTLVRPQLEQRQVNQQFGIDLYGLERNARIQQAALQRLDRNVTQRTLQGVSTPQYYQRYGNYYQNYGYGYGQ